jgi:hypothetical protein
MGEDSVTHELGQTDPGHIDVHNALVAAVEAQAVRLGVTAGTLPDAAHLGDTGHTDDHNLISAAISRIVVEARTAGATVPDAVTDLLPVPGAVGASGHVAAHNAFDASLAALATAALPYNDATGGTVTEYDEVMTRTKVDGQQFASDVGGWAAVGVNTSVASVGGRLVVTKVSAAGTAGSAQKRLPATPDQVFTVSADVVNPTGTPVSLTVTPEAGTTAIPDAAASVELFDKDGQRITLTITCPATTTQFRIRTQFSSVPGPGVTVELDNVLVESGSVADATWFDGATAQGQTGRRMRAHSFSGNGILTVLRQVKSFTVLTCGGGGGGGGSNNAAHGAAGGGGKARVQDHGLAVQDHTITVGTGGRGGGGNESGASGQPSAVAGYQSSDGGNGGSANVPGGDGAAGGGANLTSSITGTPVVYGQDAASMNGGGGMGAGPGAGGSPGPVGTNGGGSGRTGTVIVAYQIG